MLSKPQIVDDDGNSSSTNDELVAEIEVEESKDEVAVVPALPPAKTASEILIEKLGPFKSEYNEELDKISDVQCITDWSSLMPRYKQANLPMIKTGLGAIQEFHKKWAHPDWKQVVADPEEGLDVWQRTTEDGLSSVKATAIIDRTANQIFRAIGDNKYRHLYDSMFDCSHFIERIADQTYIAYHKTKKIQIVQPRDFVLVLHANKTPEGTIYAIVRHANRDDMVPTEKGVTRGALPLGGWMLEPVKGDPSKTKCYYIAEIDLKGSVPGFIMKLAIKQQGRQAVKMRRCVEAYLKDHPTPS